MVRGWCVCLGSAVLALGCAVDGAGDLGGGALAVDAGPQLDLIETGGLDWADHVEVSPGVFLVAELAESGEVGVIQLDEDTLAALADGAPPPGVPKVANPISCHEADHDEQLEMTRYCTMFGGDPVWAAGLDVVSYYYQDQGITLDIDVVMVGLYASAPMTVDDIGVLGYLRLNHSYVGFVANIPGAGDEVMALGVWTTVCPYGGKLHADLRYSGWSRHGLEGIAAADRLVAFVDCCP